MLAVIIRRSIELCLPMSVVTLIYSDLQWRVSVTLPPPCLSGGHRLSKAFVFFGSRRLSIVGPVRSGICQCWIQERTAEPNGESLVESGKREEPSSGKGAQLIDLLINRCTVSGRTEGRAAKSE